jgi:uncharacterized membrane protein YdbT with pleckstrin-like domain
MDHSMRYLDKNLLTDETILFRTKKSIIIFLIPLILTIATFFFYVNPNPYIAKAAYILIIAALMTWLNALLIYFTADFAITNKRISMKEGFFFRHSNDTRLTTIANVTVNQSLLGQLLNYGTVVINTYGGSADPFAEIDSPFQFQKYLQSQIDKVTNT